MTKAELVNEISTKTGIEKVAVQQTIESMMKVVRNSLINDENVYLRGFGSFIVKKRAKKTGRIIFKAPTQGPLCLPKRSLRASATAWPQRPRHPVPARR